MIINDNDVKIWASLIAPNPDDVSYWVDLTADPHGNIIKFFDEGTEQWINLTSPTSDLDTAKKLIKFLEGIEVGTFTSGHLGTGGAIHVDENGNSIAEFDKLKVRKRAEFFEVLIQTAKHVGGELIVSPANMICNKVEELAGVYRCYFDRGENNEANNEFLVGDQARCNVFTGSGQKYYWRFVTSVGPDYIDLSKTDCDGSGIPAEGDEMIHFGNRTNENRQSAILISAYGPDAPSIKQYMFVDSYDLTGKEATSISPTGNRFTGDFILKTGINIATQLKILEGLIKTEIQSIEHYITDEDNYLNNASFTSNMETWERGPSSTVSTSTPGLLGVNGELMSSEDFACDIVNYGDKLMLRIKASNIKQLSSNLKNKPAGDGKFYISFRYLCEISGTLECGFEGSSLYKTEQIATTRLAKIFQFSGMWDGTGDFIIKYSGDMYISLVTVTNRPLDDYKIQVSSKFEQTARNIEALVTETNNISNTIKESGWLTKADGTTIWASCTFSDGTKALSLFDVTPEGIYIKGTSLNLNGLVTFDSFSADFKTAYTKAFGDASLSAKNDVAKSFGYTDYEAWAKDAATNGKTIIINGYINTEMIDVETLLANKIVSLKGVFNGSIATPFKKMTVDNTSGTSIVWEHTITLTENFNWTFDGLMVSFKVKLPTGIQYDGIIAQFMMPIRTQLSPTAEVSCESGLPFVYRKHTEGFKNIHTVDISDRAYLIYKFQCTDGVRGQWTFCNIHELYSDAEIDAVGTDGVL